MKLIKQNFEILEQKFPVQKMDMDFYVYKKTLIAELYKFIELCGRTCYKTQDKIKEGTANDFVNRLMNNGHGAMLEHGTVYLKIKDIGWTYTIKKYEENKYSRVHVGQKDDEVLITTNLRVLFENNWMDDLKYICEPTEFHEKRYTVRFALPIGISREFIRHRVFSFAEQSTRYCNFSTYRFDNEITFVEPYWYESADSYTKNEFDRHCREVEDYYMSFINKGLKPQDAREFLPLCTASELIMTGFENDWNHFFALRALGTTGSPHPQAKELASLLMKEFIERGYYKNE